MPPIPGIWPDYRASKSLKIWSFYKIFPLLECLYEVENKPVWFYYGLEFQ